MKIIDRYVTLSFLKNYVISLMVLLGMYVVLDMVFNFSNMVEFQPDPNAGAFSTMVVLLSDIVSYYAFQCLLFFVHLSGIIPVVAAAFTLMRLSRFNELTAMLAAGVPLLRVASPIILASLILNALLLVDQELIIPALIPELTREHSDVHKAAKNYYSVQAMQDSENGLLYVARYFPIASPPTMVEMDVIEREEGEREVPDGHGGKVRVTAMQPSAHIYAKEAHWNAQENCWDLVEGRRVIGLKPDEKVSPEQPWPRYHTNITPEEISLYRSGNFVELLSTRRIDQLLDRPKSYGRLDLLRVKHWRFTQPLMNVILLLLAVPCVLTREPGRLKTAATKTLAFTGIGMGCVFLSNQLAGHPPVALAYTAHGSDTWTALMAWTPIFIFGPLAVFLLDRVKT